MMALNRVSPDRVETTINRLVDSRIRDLKAYHVPPADGLLKLDAMESPYELPQDLKLAWAKRLAKIKVNRYPDPGSQDLKASLRRVFDIPDTSDLMLGNGSDELIQIIAMLVAQSGRGIMAPIPTFSMYHIIATALGVPFIGVPLKADFALDEAPMLAEIRAHQPAVIFLAYPNNPTGNTFDDELMMRILDTAEGLVVVDEAYFAFCGNSYLGKIAQYPNLLLLRTLSKSGLAGLRLGFLVGHPLWVEQLEKLRLPYNIGVLTQESALFYLQHHDLLEQQSEQIRIERAALGDALNEIPGIRVFPSEANFLLVRMDRCRDGHCSIEMIFNDLQQEGVLVRNLHAANTALENCLRVTVSTPEENQTFLRILDTVLSRVNYFD